MHACSCVSECVSGGIVQLLIMSLLYFPISITLMFVLLPSSQQVQGTPCFTTSSLPAAISLHPRRLPRCSLPPSAPPLLPLHRRVTGGRSQIGPWKCGLITQCMAVARLLGISPGLCGCVASLQTQLDYLRITWDRSNNVMRGTT